MHPTERRVLCNAKSHLHVFKKAQNFEQFPFNKLKAALLITVWPFSNFFGSSFFVESGCFSMLCFAIACESNPKLSVRASHKMFWYNLFMKHRIPTPELFAYTDSDGNLTIKKNDQHENGVYKPMRGMYGHGVGTCSLHEFCARKESDEMFSQQIISNPPRRTFRICTLRTFSGVRVISMFFMTMKDQSVSFNQWLTFEMIGKRLCRVHEEDVSFAPLVAWDTMLEASTGTIYLLEGNLGGNVNMHFVPFCTTAGPVRCSDAAKWLQDVRKSDMNKIYHQSSAVKCVT